MRPEAKVGLLVLLVAGGCGSGGHGGAAGAGGEDDGAATGGVGGGLDAGAGQVGLDGSPDVAASDAGPDAAVEAAPFACAIAPTTQLPVAFIVDQGFTTDASATYTVPKGFRLHGTVTLPALPPNGKLGYGQMTAAAETGVPDAVLFIPGGDGNTFTYDLVVPPGRYTLEAYFQVDFSDPDEGASISRTAREPVDVCGDQLHDVTLPALGPLHETALMLTGLSAFDPLLGASRETKFSLQSADGSLSMGATGDTDVGDVASERALTPDQTLQAWIRVEDTGKDTAPRQGGFRTSVRATDVPSAASVEDVLPALAKLSGTITDPNGVLTPGAQHTVSCDGTGESASADYSDDALAYRTFVRKGASCRLSNSFQTPLVTGTPAPNENGSGTLTLPFPGELVTASADAVHDFTLPAIDAAVTIDVQVEDADHVAVVGATVRASSTALAAPTLAHTLFETDDATTDATGHAKLHVVPGAYRWVEIDLP